VDDSLTVERLRRPQLNRWVKIGEEEDINSTPKTMLVNTRSLKYKWNGYVGRMP